VAKAADDTTDLYGVLFKPIDFDSTRTYPVIDFIYNGPQIAIVPRMFVGPSFPNAFGVLAQALAQSGFVVFMVDGRGTIERGKAFQDLVYRNFGRYEIPDHVAVLKQLAKRYRYLDLSRVGITGSSWGGYMTVRAMVTAPEVYRVGVAGVPVMDIYDHITVMEPYMDLPQNDPEGYDYASSLRLAANLEGDLLMIAGTSDLNAPFSATMKMVDALTKAGKPYSLVVLPEQNHITAGQSRAYRTEATRRFFETHLLPRR
jgi:dipeptidyl aminopeptidase/acylaminoacyl peptidase